ncbi:MAG: MBL fold metallo-hydrolase [Bacteroidales bacterium]|nr:MBL fold metallo-hydrolase [Bacteroidales bacterium]
MKTKYILSIFVFIFSFQAFAQRDFSDSKITKVILLGTGTPNPSPDHAGSSLAILVNNTPYIIDFGAGIVRNAAAISTHWGGPFEGMNVKNIKRAFLTHLHSDHTVGYPDLILTPWVMGRNAPLEVYGPEGIQSMTDHILEAYKEDIAYRIYGDEPANNQGWRVNAHEIIKEGVIFQDENVKVEAFPVVHGSWPNAWGFRFTTPDKVIVVSGDTKPCPKIEEYAQGADILIHEVYSQAGFDKKDPFWKNYHSKNHTSTYELADLANKTQPRIIVLTHLLFWGSSEEDLLNEIAEKYKGKVYVGRDLDIY